MSDTPMIAQYKQIKAQHQDKILFFRLGDFYEMFYEDAQIASRELEITLTSREVGKGRRIPMCGIPYHAADGYIVRLLEKGYKVAICEQVENPKASNGLVQREVVRVITPGTFLDPQAQEAKKNNYLVAIVRATGSLGLAVVDAGTGDFRMTEFTGPEQLDSLRSELIRLQPAECLYPQEDQELAGILQEARELFPLLPTPRAGTDFSLSRCRQLLAEQLADTSILDATELPTGICAAGALIAYLRETQKVKLVHLTQLTPYRVSDYMVLDGATRRNLELTRSLRGGNPKATLLGVLDYTCTAMGGRTLRQWLEQPLVMPQAIRERLDAVAALVDDSIIRTRLREGLKGIYDLERLMGKVVYQTANARDLLALRRSLAVLPEIKAALAQVKVSKLIVLKEYLDPCVDVCQLLEEALAEDPPVGLREGNLIKPGYHEEVDRLRELTRKGKEWLAELEARERERTGIKSLKVGYNKVFGYYLEVTKSNLDAVPSDYIRKQTLVNAERFITPELKEWEAEITGARERCLELEYKLFVELRQKVAGEIDRVQRAARVVGELDALLSLAQAAIENRYVKPEVSLTDEIIIEEGRHPVVEKVQANTPFVPNDTRLDNRDNQLLLLTGPNMAGKSTYIRQVALIVLLAQVGSFVPARSARIGIVDRIFTRIGAADDLAAGESTFMVEMKEVGNILRYATRRSLIILDEVGRGTSTYDGLSIAQAVAEYIANPARLGSKTLFATHYHELTELASHYPQIKNYTIAVEERGNDIIFLRKIIPGATDRSYGIHVARLAGLPEEVIQRARELLALLEEGKDGKRDAAPACEMVQLDLFTASRLRILEEIKQLDPLNMTPLEALNTIFRLHSYLAGEEAPGEVILSRESRF